MHDPAYKLMFGRPRMVRDLLDGFAARGWSDALDFDALESLSASFVSRGLRQRHGDLLWRVRFRDGRRLYLMLLLEFQATVDRAMSVRLLTYTGLLYERLAADGALRGGGVLPPVLPVVIYNGRRRWTAPVEMRELVAGESDLLAPYQPSQRYYLLDAGRTADADLPPGNLVSALVGLERTRDGERVLEPLQVLVDLLAAAEDEALTEVFEAWVRHVVPFADRLPAGGGNPLARLREIQTMLAENMREWTQERVEQGRAQGIEQGRTEGLEQGRTEGLEQGRTEGLEQGRTEGLEQGRTEGLEQERALLCRQAARKFDAGAAEGLAAALAGVTDADRLARVGDWIIECASASELLALVHGDGRSDG